MRHLWFDNRHLLGDTAGQALRSALEALDPRPREMILTTGDRLAAFSLALAQSFCRRAPAAWRVFGAQRFARWVRIGEHLASTEPTSCDGAVAYFSIDPHVVARLGLDVAEEWVVLGRETLKVSRRLGSVFFQTTAPLLATLPQPLMPRLRAWTTHGSALLQVKGWKGEFLAASYFEAASVALPILAEEDIAAWSRLGALIQDSGPWTFYARMPDGFAAFTGPQRALLFSSCQAAAALSAKAAEEVFFRLPPVLAGLSAEERAFFLTLFAPVFRSAPGAIAPLLPLLAPCCKAVGLALKPWLCAVLVDVAHEFPAGVAPLVRTLPRVCEEAGDDGVRAWLEKGSTVARDNPAAGEAFFALASRTSVRVLHQASPGVDLEEVQELLRKYIHMLSGTTVGIRAYQGCAYPPPLEAFPLYESDLPLPSRIDLCSTYEENFRLFCIFAAQQAGRREFDTYDFSLATLWPRLPAPVRQIMNAGNGNQPQPSTPDPHSPICNPQSAIHNREDDLFAYFRCFPHPELVEKLFLLIESERISGKLKQTYRGLGEDLQWVAAMPLPGLLPDLLTSNLRLRRRVHSLTTVYDSARLAAESYLELLASLAVAQEQAQQPSVFGSLFLDKITGDALLDPDMEDDSLPPTDTPELPALQLDPERDERDGGTPLSPEELKALLEAGVDLQIRQGKSDARSPQGLYITTLLGKMSQDGEREDIASASDLFGKARREHDEGLTFFYDEWDYQIVDYRSRWCCLREIVLAGDGGEFFTKTLDDYAALAPTVKHEFQRIRPEQYRIVRGLEHGEEFDLNAVVTAAIDRRARVSSAAKFYTARHRTERDVAALFLLDMSASTDEPVVALSSVQATEEEPDRWAAMGKQRPVRPQSLPRRIIDVTKESLVLMAEALEEIGDAYAIYGFSGQGKDNVEFYHVKSFAEVLSPTVKGRISAIAPKRSTRMGAALRHAVGKLKDVSCRVKLLVLLSDGFPQDMDYGTDRRSITYGVRDTMVALQEADRAGVLTFCLTVDKAGHDYLREMCEPSRYLVLEDVMSLPLELPKVYQRYIRPRGV